MNKRIGTFALMISLASSLAFACDEGKSTTSAGSAQPPAATDNSTPGNSCPCADNTKDNKQNKKDKDKTKPDPSEQEEQFNRVLQGIYG